MAARGGEVQRVVRQRHVARDAGEKCVQTVEVGEEAPDEGTDQRVRTGTEESRSPRVRPRDPGLSIDRNDGVGCGLEYRRDGCKLVPREGFRRDVGDITASVRSDSSG